MRIDAGRLRDRAGRPHAIWPAIDLLVLVTLSGLEFQVPLRDQSRKQVQEARDRARRWLSILGRALEALARVDVVHGGFFSG